MEAGNVINTMLIMDIVITVLGSYLIYIALKMKKNKKVDRLVVAEEMLRMCKDEAGFAEYLSQKMLVFSVVLVITGVLLAIHEAVFSLGVIFYVVTAVAIIAFLWFYKSLADGRNKFC